MTAFYNEIDPDAVAALEELIACGIIAPGKVDSRSIKDVTADDLKGFTQVHLFAGAGLWSLAARWAGWPDARPLWSASCPCQGESLAGKQLGADDPRHLWPDVYRLIRATRERGFGPPVLVGEQVAAAAGTHWLDRVCSDLAEQNYAARSVDVPACAVDAPHQRQRLWWVALADALDVEGRRGLQKTSGGERRELGNGDVADTESLGGRRDEQERGPQERAANGRSNARGCDVEHADSNEQRLTTTTSAGHRNAIGAADGSDRRKSDVDHAERAGREGLGGYGDRRGELGRRSNPAARDGQEPPATRSATAPDDSDAGCPLVDAESQRRREGSAETGVFGRRPASTGANVREQRHGINGSWWADAEWITCHDGKARRAKPAIPMLVNGMAGRISLWRLAGNSISPVLAAEVIGALLDAEKEITP